MSSCTDCAKYVNLHKIAVLVMVDHDYEVAHLSDLTLDFTLEVLLIFGVC